MQILLSGGSRGIGGFIASGLMKKHHRLFVISRSRENLEKFASQCPEFSCTKSRIFSGDVSQRESLLAIKEKMLKEGTKLNAIVCCAGIHGPIGPAVDSDPLSWEKVIATNLVGTYFMVRIFFDLLERKTQRAKIIFFSGGGASQGRPLFSAYAAAKTGVVRLAETLAAELSEGNVDVNALAPGVIYTDLLQEILDAGPGVAGQKEYLSAKKISEKPTSEQEKSRKNLLETVEFLLSPESDGISGRFLSAVWDDLKKLPAHKKELPNSEIFTLRRIIPQDRGLDWGVKKP